GASGRQTFPIRSVQQEDFIMQSIKTRLLLTAFCLCVDALLIAPRALADDFRAKSLPIQISSDFSPTIRGEVEPHLAVNPTNPRNIVAAWIASQPKFLAIVAGVSLDGGKTWTNVVIPKLTVDSGGALYDRCGDPWLSFAPNGELYLATVVNWRAT